MSLYANEGGTLKNMSPLDSGSFKITGIDYFGDYTSSSDSFTIQLSKTLGSYKYLIILATRERTVSTDLPTVGGIPAVVSVSKFLESAISGKCNGYTIPIAAGSQGIGTYGIEFRDVKSVTSAVTTLTVSATSSSVNNLIYEYYGCSNST